MENAAQQHIRLFLGKEILQLYGIWNMTIPEDYIFWSPPPFFVHGLPMVEAGYLEINEARLLLHPEDLLSLREECRKIGSEQPVYCYFRIITPLGALKVVYLEAIVHNEYGHKTCFALLKEERSDYTLLADEAEGISPLIGPSLEEFTDAGTWQFNFQTYKVYYSANLYRIYDVIPGSLKAHTETFRKFIHPDDKKIVSEAIDRSIRESIPFNLEYRIITDAGRSKWIKNTARIVRNRLSEKLMIGVLRDVTENKKGELATRDANEAQVFQQEVLITQEKFVQAGTWQFNLHTRKIAYSENFYRLHGAKPQVIHPPADFFLHTIYPDDRDKVNQAITEVLEAKAPHHFSYRIVRPDGRTRSMTVNTRTIWNADKEPVLIAVVRDVTEEEDIHTSFTEVNSTKAWLSEMADLQETLMGSGSWHTDPATRRTHFSPGACRLFGMKDPVQAEPESLAKWIQEGVGESSRAAFFAIIREPREGPLLLRIVTPDGQPRLLRLQNKLRVDGTAAGKVMGVISDITKMDRLEEDLEELNRFSEILNGHIKEVYVVTDTIHNLLACNKRFMDEHVARGTILRNTNLFDAAPHLKQPDFINSLNRALRGETVFVPAHRSIRPKSHINIHMVPVRDAHQKQKGIFILFQDVTTDLTLRGNLHKQLQLRSTLLEQAMDRIIVLDDNLDFLVWNKACEAWFGYKEEQVVGKNVLEIFPAFRQENSYRCYQRAFSGERIHLPAGQAGPGEKRFEEYMLPLYNREEAVFAVMWMVRDVTLEQTLMETRVRTALLLDTLQKGCFELDEAQRFLYLDARGARILSLPESRLIGRCIWEVFPQLEETPFYAAIMRGLKERSPVREVVSVNIGGQNLVCTLVPAQNGLLVLLDDGEEYPVAGNKADKGAAQRTPKEAKKEDPATDIHI